MRLLVSLCRRNIRRQILLYQCFNKDHLGLETKTHSDNLFEHSLFLQFYLVTKKKGLSLTIEKNSVWFFWSISCKIKVSIWSFWVSVRAIHTNRWTSLCFVCVWACVSAGIELSMSSLLTKTPTNQWWTWGDTSHQCDYTENWDQENKHTNNITHTHTPQHEMKLTLVIGRLWTINRFASVKWQMN